MKKQSFLDEFLWGKDRHCPNCEKILTQGEISWCFGGCFSCFAKEQEEKIKKTEQMRMDAEKFNMLLGASTRILAALIQVFGPSNRSPRYVAQLAVEYAKELALEREREVKRKEDK